MVKELRDKTGAGMMACREALQNTQGDVQKAMDFLRQKGIASADKKKDRVASEGRIATYIHTGGKVGVMVELNCETDFVAKTDDFNQLAKDICMHIAAMAPAYVNRDEVPGELIEREREGYMAAAKEDPKNKNKPAEVLAKIAEGKVDKYIANACLLNQPWVRDDKKTIEQLIKETVGKLGENIVVRRFVRYGLGDGK
jgi:elongation factor Ts